MMSPRWIVFPERSLRLGLALAAGAMLVACGGGGGAPGTGNLSITESQTRGTGTVTGFGSVIIDGVKYDDSLTAVRVLDDDSTPRDESLGAIRLGMRVEMRTDDQGRLSHLDISPELKGPITAINEAGKTFELLKQTVLIVSDGPNATLFEGSSGLSSLGIGMVVEVHGTRNAEGQIVASRIERKSAGEAVNIRLTGTVSALDTGEKTFSIGALTVDYSAVASNRLLPNASALEIGKRVSVWSDSPVSGAGQLSARAISVRSPAAAIPSDRVRLSGLSGTTDSSTKTFMLNGIRVVYGNAEFKNGQSANLGSSTPVRVQGTLNSDGSVAASEVRFVSRLYSNNDTPSIGSEVTGVITDFVGISNFKVRGVPIDASSGSIEFEGGTTANLANGVLIKVEGLPSATALLPNKIRFATTAETATRWLVGQITDRASSPGTGVDFRLMGIDVRLATDVTITRFDGTAAAPSDLVNAQVVRLNGAMASGVFVARAVVLMPGDLSTLPRELEGIASGVTLDANGNGSFKIGQITVTTSSASTTFEGAVSSLTNGVRVEAYGPVSGSAPNLTLAATKVEVKLPELGPRVGISGMVSEFTSQAGVFKIGSQRVNASARVAVTGLGNGRFARAKGVMVDGVLIVNNSPEHKLELR